MVMVELVDVRT